VIRTVGHVGDQQRVFYSTPDSADVMEHFVDRDRKRVLVAEHGHGQGIADEGDIDSGFIDQARGGVVVSGQASDGFVKDLFFAESSSGEFVARFADRCKTHDILQCPSANRADRACARRPTAVG